MRHLLCSLSLFSFPTSTLCPLPNSCLATPSRPLLAQPPLPRASLSLSRTRSGDPNLHNRDPPRASLSLALDLEMPISTAVTHPELVSLYADLSFSFSFRFRFFFFFFFLVKNLWVSDYVFGGLQWFMVGLQWVSDCVFFFFILRCTKHCKIFFGLFSGMQPNTEIKLFFLKLFSFANILRWKIIYNETNGA